MQTEKYITEKISWYKLLFTVLVTVSAGTIGWYVNNYSGSLPYFVILDVIAFTGFLAGIVITFSKIRFYLKKLQEEY